MNNKQKTKRRTLKTFADCSVRSGYKSIKFLFSNPGSATPSRKSFVGGKPRRENTMKKSLFVVVALLFWMVFPIASLADEFMTCVPVFGGTGACGYKNCLVTAGGVTKTLSLYDFECANCGPGAASYFNGAVPYPPPYAAEYGRCITGKSCLDFQGASCNFCLSRNSFGCPSQPPVCEHLPEHGLDPDQPASKSYRQEERYVIHYAYRNYQLLGYDEERDSVTPPWGESKSGLYFVRMDGEPGASTFGELGHGYNKLSGAIGDLLAVLSKGAPTSKFSYPPTVELSGPSQLIATSGRWSVSWVKVPATRDGYFPDGAYPRIEFGRKAATAEQITRALEGSGLRLERVYD